MLAGKLENACSTNYFEGHFEGVNMADRCESIQTQDFQVLKSWATIPLNKTEGKRPELWLDMLPELLLTVKVVKPFLEIFPGENYEKMLPRIYYVVYKKDLSKFPISVSPKFLFGYHRLI